MEVYFLGTGTSQGIPVIGSHHSVCLSDNPKDKRLRVSVWIHNKDTSIVIDCGPDFRQQMLTSNCKKVDAILFTHEHSDHTAGIDDIRPFNFKQGKIPIYGHARVIQNLKKRFEYVFETENRYPGAPSVEPIEVVNDVPFKVNDINVIPINASHGNLQVFGYRMHNFVYLTDVKTIETEEIEKIKGVNILVINALREEPHHSHFSLQDALDFVTLVQPKTTYLTHISHLLGFHDLVEKKLPPNVFLAYDNLQISI
ncbi:MBL fold metallo-hydrolase [Flavobacterium sp.]|uniref:MBL fold metallo-hydrolase n=1 Tax=Flavobacterium sp. TaxID=239 RepID=UPI003BBF4CF9